MRRRRTSEEVQEAFEQAVKDRGWSFPEDYQYKSVNKPVTLICPLGFPHKVCVHWFTVSTGTPKGYWNRERCQYVASKFKRRTQLYKTYNRAYEQIHTNGWLDLFDGYEDPETRDRCIYTITNDTLKQAYVGLTFNFEERVKGHKSTRGTTTHKLSRHPDSVFRQITGYLPQDEATGAERQACASLVSSGQYEVLNSERALGNLGGNTIKHSAISLRETALKYKTRWSFGQGSPNEYEAALHRGAEFMDDICSHMISQSLARSRSLYHTPNGVFTSTRKAAEANNCSNLTVTNRCKNPDSKPKGNRTPSEWRGKTWRELGWSMEAVEI